MARTVNHTRRETLGDAVLGSEKHWRQSLEFTDTLEEGADRVTERDDGRALAEDLVQREPHHGSS